MFALFFDLYLAMFLGTWIPYSTSDITLFLSSTFNGIGSFITSIFSGVTEPMDNLGTCLFGFNDVYSHVPNYLPLIAFILALITCIGIVVVATKGIKKIFTVFFYGVR